MNRAGLKFFSPVPYGQDVRQNASQNANKIADENANKNESVRKA